MAFPELHVFAADDINGTAIETIPFTSEYLEAVSIRTALREVGTMGLRLSRQYAVTLADSSVFTPDNFCRLLIPAVSTTRYFGGGFFGDQVRQLVARIAAGEDININLMGPAWYLSRAILWDEQFYTPSDVEGPHRIDLANGVFRFEGDADFGNLVSRLLHEDENNTIAQFLPDITKTFDVATDSNGDAWTDALGTTAEPFELPIGQNFLDGVFAALEVLPNVDMTWDIGTVASPKLEMSAWQNLTGYGTDRVPSGVSDFSSGVVHFKKGVNIASDVAFHSAGRRKATHDLAIGNNAKFGRAVRSSYTAGSYARAIAIERGDLQHEPALDRAAARYLRHQELGENEYAVGHYPGFAPTSGLYMPGPHSTNGHYWLGDSVGLTTAVSSPTVIDLSAESELVTAITLDMRNVVKDGDATEGALSWNVVAELNVERSSFSSPDNKDNGAVSICCGPDHPDTGTPGTPPTAPTELLRWSFTDRGGADADNLLDDNTDDFYWFSPNWETGVGTAAWHADYDAHMSWGNSGAVTQPVVPTASGIPVTAGTIYTFSTDMSQRQSDSNAWMRVEWYEAGGTQLQIDYIAGPSVSVAAKSTYTKVVTAPATATFIRLRVDAATGEFGAADNIVISYGGSSGTAGTPGTSPVTTVGGTGAGQYSDSTEYVPVGSVLEHTYITSGGPYHVAEDITVADAGDYFIGAEVEAVLQEIGAGLNLTIDTIDPSGASQDLDVSAHSVFEVYLSADCTITFTGMVTGRTNRWWVHVFGDGTHVADFPDVLWPDNTAPTFDATADSHWLEFVSTDALNVYGDYGGAAPTELTISDEGTPLATAATSLDFVGAGVVASGATAAKTITISGAPTGAAGGDLSGTYPNPSVVDDSHSHTAATLPAASGGIGEILISDTPSTPLVFADLLQNDDQTDLLYGDP